MQYKKLQKRNGLNAVQEPREEEWTESQELMHNQVVQKKIDQSLNGLVVQVDSKKEQGSCLKQSLRGGNCSAVVRGSRLLLVRSGMGWSVLRGCPQK